MSRLGSYGRDSSTVQQCRLKAIFHLAGIVASVTRKKSPNVYISCPKIISLEKWQILTSAQKLPKNVKDLDKLIVAKALKSCPKCKKSPNLVTLIVA